MSKQDTHFFNVFSVVIGLLVTVSICLFAYARSVGLSEQTAHVLKDPMYVAEVQSRTALPVKVAVAGQDNSALAIVAPAATGAAVAVALPADGPATFEAACKACHGAGIAGAPKAGDKAAWAPRIAQGKDTLYQHAIQGYNGKAGVMPAKGGRADLTDQLVQQAVDYMTSL